MLKQLLSGLCDLVAPPSCAGCASLVDSRMDAFCGGCRLLLEPAPEPCAQASDRDAFVYGGPLRDALHRLKYAGASELCPQLSPLLTEAARAFLGQVDCVAAIPLHPRRLRARGYNQSALLARPVARMLAVPFQPRLLRRIRDAPPQVGATRSERQVQLAHAFVASRRAARRRVLVVDDVRTTGATFDEARRALEAVDVHAVCTLAFACAPADDESG